MFTQYNNRKDRQQKTESEIRDGEKKVEVSYAIDMTIVSSIEHCWTMCGHFSCIYFNWKWKFSSVHLTTPTNEMSSCQTVWTGLDTSINAIRVYFVVNSINISQARWHQLLHHNTCTMYIECYWQLHAFSLSLSLDKCHKRWTELNKQTNETEEKNSNRINIGASVCLNIPHCMRSNVWNRLWNRCVRAVFKCIAILFHYNSRKHLDISHCIMCIDAFFHSNAIALEKT